MSLIFGLLDIANIAQPAFVILGAYATYVVNNAYGTDPILVGLLFTPVFYGVGAVVYRVYYSAFERRGDEALRGLVFFFGILFIMEVSLSLKCGVDYRLVQAPTSAKSIEFGGRRHRLSLHGAVVVGIAWTLALYGPGADVLRAGNHGRLQVRARAPEGQSRADQTSRSASASRRSLAAALLISSHGGAVDRPGTKSPHVPITVPGRHGQHRRHPGASSSWACGRPDVDLLRPLVVAGRLLRRPAGAGRAAGRTIRR